MTKHLTFFRYLAYSIEIILLTVLQSTPNLMPEFFGGKPLLLVPLALVLASREDCIPSIVLGAVCGVFTDIASGGFIGFFAVTLTHICYFESYIFSTYLVPGIVPTLIISVIFIPILLTLYFLTFTVWAGIPDWGILFVNHYISRIVYTFVMILPIYFINLFFYKKLS